MARWGLSACLHFTFARAHPEGDLRESCMRYVAAKFMWRPALTTVKTSEPVHLDTT